MSISILPRRIGCGDHMTMSTNTTTVIEKKNRTYTREDCGDTNTTPVIEEKKRAYKRKDCSDTNTTPVMEKKKRAYKRKDCGDTNTTTVTEKKKRAYKRKDCGDKNITTVVEEKKRACTRQDWGDTSTTPVMEKKKRAYKRKDCGDTNTTTVTEKKKRACKRKVFLPHDLIMEEILTKLPVPTLLKSVLVSRLWYNSIHNDHRRLTYSHFLQSQKRPDLILSLSNVRSVADTKTGAANYETHFFRLTTGDFSHDNVLKFRRFPTCVNQPYIWELVGYCNGLPCMAQVGNYSNNYIILDPNRKDFLYIYYPAVVGKRISNPHIICHGFGFDPLANVFKLVSILSTAQKELNFLVFTLGTKSWRNVTAESMPISGHGGRPVIKIRAPTGSDKSAIFCTTSRCLVWKIITTLGGAGSYDTQLNNSNAVNNEMEMLLSFNLHEETFQFIQLPTKSTTDKQQKHLLVDHPHLLESKGSPCIVRIEKKVGNESDYCHRRCDAHQGSSSCCCCCKVHLYVLKDEAKEVWVKEESFDVRINSTSTWLSNLSHLAPDPCCFCFSSTTTPPTRIFSFSDQMLLYWFNGDSLQVYNLRSEKLQLVLPSYCTEKLIFRTKMKEPRHIFISSDDDDIYCSNMDYQLHRHEENFLSLQTFIPEGVEGVSANVFNGLDLKRKDRPCLGYVSIYRGSRVYHPFY